MATLRVDDLFVTPITGTVAKTTGSAVLTGTGTQFTTQLYNGAWIVVPGGGANDVRRIVSIASDTSLTVAKVFGNTASGQVASRLDSAGIIQVDRYNPLPVRLISDITSVPGSVDTELAAAVTASDALANPTTAPVLSHGLMWDGSQWVRARGTTAGGQIVDTELPAAAALADGAANPTVPMVGAGALLWNGATWDRYRNNFEGIALASAARTANTASADLISYNSIGIIAVLNVTAASGAGGLQVRVQGKDPVSGNYYNLNDNPTAVTATGIYNYQMWPGNSSTNTGSTRSHSGVLARTFRIFVIHADSSSYTYSVGYVLCGV